MFVAGVDEVGVGPLAGPVTGGVVLLESGRRLSWYKAVRDSKVLSAKRREGLAEKIRGTVHWAVASATHDEIDANEELSPDPSEQARREYWATTYSTPYPYHPWRLDYEPWPGPNSNTFVANLLRAVPGMGAELDHNSVGKDWVEGHRLGRTDDGLGVEVDATFFGAAIGLYQGLELHMIGLTAGISFWPPALKIPFLPRFGVHPGWVRARW